VVRGEEDEPFFRVILQPVASLINVTEINVTEEGLLADNVAS